MPSVPIRQTNWNGLMVGYEELHDPLDDYDDSSDDSGPLPYPYSTTIDTIRKWAAINFECPVEHVEVVENFLSCGQVDVLLPGYANEEDLDLYRNGPAIMPMGVELRLVRTARWSEPRYNAAFRLGGWQAVKELWVQEMVSR